MNEEEALVVTAVRAVETTDRARALWSDADRAWASRAAAEVVGEAAPPDAFLARRATLALERLGARYAPLRKLVLAVRWRGWIGPAIAIAAFAAGVAVDRISGREINLLAPPVLAIVAWNLGVYLWLVVAPLIRTMRRERDEAGPIRGAIVRLAGHLDRMPRHDAASPLGAALAAFAADWARSAAPLYQARAARILHFAAAALAIGVIAGLYVRGLAFEYRATWESTFLDAETVHRIVAIVLWPGAFVTGLPLPTLAEIQVMRTSGAPASQNAAAWLHLMAATVAIVVVVPRLALAALDHLLERHRASHLALALDEPYFQRALRGFHGGPSRVSVVPYSYRVPPASLAGLQSIVARAFGGSTALVVASPVAYGDEDRLPDSARPDASGPVFALFSLAATPERETQGAFVDALRSGAGAQPVIVLVDEAPFRERTAGDTRRIDERRATWSELFADRGVEPVFADLAKPDLAAIETAIETRLAPRR